ncbi:HD-GYP domain-containing protein [Iodobacter fluviatilis]|uniref:Cyclic di-GMP phosphodiesterase response regulator RpfG n=1 Tax=Iodobacter fluviatilis TaxID=537 RepID=A0A377Q1S5_9NEIS|nr:HD domain-containing phosphohydrolase [Iodobacter fluviatilis]TCU90189.1 HD domain-containing protein [Iodobacter fluviatilis]STQ89216.1 Cyclic di-GMP phosphodiesterase response regulator RpfG [Iodobacter fluviatilis]
MKAFKKRTAIRIATVSIALASLASPVAWYVEKENTEEGIVALAIEESGRLLHHYDAVNLSGPNTVEHAKSAAQTISGGLFDIAEIYNAAGQKLAESLTSEGEAVDFYLTAHGRPGYTQASYESLKLPGTRWVLRVFVPLRGSDNTITGYFEGVRVVPAWQHRQILSSSLTVALMVCLAALLCGAALYPVVVHLSTDNERKAREVLDSHISMMEALGRAIAKRDSDTGAHNYRVAWIAAFIAERMKSVPSGREMQGLIAGSFLHDVGKIGIPDAILLKPGKLDEAELVIMRTHVSQGEQIVKGMGWLDGAHEVVAAHHEKWDGSGYPRQLQGEEIPLSARIFAVADVFDALCSKRPYKEPMGFDDAMDILEKGRASHFDPGVMDVFRPLAADIFQKLANISEADAHDLLKERIRQHFEMQ